MAQTTRRLIAVLAADIAGFSRLMEAEPERTHARMMELEAAVVRPAIARFAGRLVKSTGDGFLASFDSARSALECAQAIQSSIAERVAAEPPANRLLYRIGLNIAEAFLDGGDIYGDGVNIAARLQTHAEAGGLVATAAICELVGQVEGIDTVDIGELRLKNISRPIRAFSLRAAARPALPPAQAGSDGRPSIAIVPFHAASRGRSDAYFAEGIIEGIIHVLSGLREVFVLSQGSTLAYAGPAVDPRRVGRELGVRYVLHGTVRRLSNHLRIRTELSDAASGAVLRSDQYDGHSRDLFAMQDRISSEVVSAIAPEVREQELHRAMRKHPDNMSAYDFLLQALDQLHRFDRDSFFRAGGLLQQAISDDPGYASARSYLAWWHILRISQGWSTDPGVDRREAGRQSTLAVDLDGSDFLALAIRGHGLAWMRQYQASMQMLDRAVAVGPNCALAWTMRGLTCGFLGDTAEAVRSGELALRLAPSDPFSFYHQSILAQGYYVAGRVEEAIALAIKVFARCETFGSNLRLLTVALMAAGRPAEARAMAIRLLAAEPDFRLSAFAERTVLPLPYRDDYIIRMRDAGIPET
ncbi:MAG: adenylate/guanylate cyclase domain-containing protein [Acetobacteraceae bacterium]|nr:adenylate/guanylate cyclase domain-containing protein [Acetobacteraceae bacterium]